MTGTYTFINLDDPFASPLHSNVGPVGDFLPGQTVNGGTMVMGVSAGSGAVVGGYIDANGNANAFVYNGSTFTTLNNSGQFGSALATGVNDSGQIIGIYGINSGADTNAVNSFLYSGGTYTTIADPSGTFTAATGINDHGQIVGAYFSGDGSNPSGFLFSNGAFTTINDPLGSTGTWAWSINNAGVIVGFYADSSNIPHGFILKNGMYTTVDDPLGVQGTAVTGINDAGQIVGFYGDASGNFHVFVDSNGTFTTISDASLTELLAFGINDAGQIVGDDVDSNGELHGFLASPPISSTLNAATINDIYQGVLQRAATQSEISNWLTQDTSVGDVAVISQIVKLPEAQFNVYPIIQIIQLATGDLPTAHQLAGWVPFIEQNGVLQGQSQTNPLLDQMALAFVASDNFGKFYNNGTDVDPNSTVTALEMQVIIKAATGVAATQAQINAWVSTGQTIDQVFVDFALGDQYTAFSQPGNQQYLITVADAAAGIQGAAVIGSSDASHSLVSHA